LVLHLADINGNNSDGKKRYNKCRSPWFNLLTQQKRFKCLLYLVKKWLKIHQLLSYQQLLIEYIHIRGSKHQSKNEKLVDDTFDDIQDQTLTYTKEKTSKVGLSTIIKSENQNKIEKKNTLLLREGLHKLLHVKLGGHFFIFLTFFSCLHKWCQLLGSQP